MKILHKISHVLLYFVVIQVSSVVLLQTDAQAQSCDPNVSTHIFNPNTTYSFNRTNPGVGNSVFRIALINEGSVDVSGVELMLFDLTNNVEIFNVDGFPTIAAGIPLNISYFFNAPTFNTAFEYEITSVHGQIAQECDVENNVQRDIFYDDRIFGGVPTDINGCPTLDFEGGYENEPLPQIPRPGVKDVCDEEPIFGDGATVIVAGSSQPVRVALKDGRTLSVPVSIDVMVIDKTTSYTMAQTTAHYVNGTLDHVQRQSFDPSGAVTSETIHYY